LDRGWHRCHNLFLLYDRLSLGLNNFGRFDFRSFVAFRKVLNSISVCLEVLVRLLVLNVEMRSIGAGNGRSTLVTPEDDSRLDRG